MSKIFSLQEDDLLSLWVADKVYDIIKDEDVALKALSFTEDEIKKQKKKTKK